MNTTVENPFTQRELGALKILAETLTKNPEHPSASVAYARLTKPETMLRLLNQHQELIERLTSTNAHLTHQLEFNAELKAASEALLAENKELQKRF